MIKFEHTETVGWQAAIRGMRNPMNSCDKSDSGYCDIIGDNFGGLIIPENYRIGPNDHDLMMRLRKAGTDHRTFMGMIVVYVDITAPLYWWKEFDTYGMGIIANSCLTIHKIQSNRLTLDDFSTEHLTIASLNMLDPMIDYINKAIFCYRDFNEKEDWWQIVQLLPSSYNQKRTLMLNYEVLANIYHSHKNYKLDEWKELCKWIESLPYPELITGLNWETEVEECMANYDPMDGPESHITLKGDY